MSKPYTYLIGWSKHQKFYYGVRFARNCAPEDLWTTYFTSSKTVQQFRKECGDPDIIQIRKTFRNVDDARLWEERLLKRIDAARRSDFLNKANGKAIPPELASHKGSAHPGYGKKRSESTLAKLRGVKKSENHKNNMKGKRPHVNQKGRNNNAFKGFIQTPYGVFESLHAAAAVENVDYSTIAYRIHSNSEKFTNYKRIPQ